jgi:hypothetical protein
MVPLIGETLPGARVWWERSHKLERREKNFHHCLRLPAALSLTCLVIALVFDPKPGKNAIQFSDYPRGPNTDERIKLRGFL